MKPETVIINSNLFLLKKENLIKEIVVKMDGKNTNKYKKQKYNDIDKKRTLSKALSKVLRHEAVNLGLAISPDGYVSVNDILSLNGNANNTGTRGGDRRGGRGNRGGRGGRGGRTRGIRFSQYTLEDIKTVVADNDKQRFRLSRRMHPSFTTLNLKAKKKKDDEIKTDDDRMVLCIRANQGHTMKCIDEEQLLTPILSDELGDNINKMEIIHGTYRKAWSEHIQKEGLSRMKRNHIHFAAGLPSGFRLGGNDYQSQTGENAVKVISGMRNSCDILIYVNGIKCAQDRIPFFRSDNGVLLTSGLNKSGILPVEYFLKVVDVKSNRVILDQQK